MSQVAASPVPTEKVFSPENTNVYDVVISAVTLKKFQDSQI